MADKRLAVFALDIRVEANCHALTGMQKTLSFTIGKGQKCHLAVIVSGQRRANSPPRLDVNHLRKVLCVIQRKISKMVYCVPLFLIRTRFTA